MNKKQKANTVYNRLKLRYPDLKCGLDYGGDPFRLLVLAILSAQCTDARVNMKAPALFDRFPDAKSIAESKIGELEAYIYSLGLSNSKASNIRRACRVIIDEFDNKIPHEMKALLKLGGVGRKVANLIRGDIFGLGGIVADTHCIRICSRLGFTGIDDNPLAVEMKMDKLIEKQYQSDFCHILVVFGREVCRARNPDCKSCELVDLCHYVGRLQAKG